MRKRSKEEVIQTLRNIRQGSMGYPPFLDAIDMAIEALKNEPILCEDCRHRNTWDNGRLVPQYYRCGRGVKFRDYGYVREDDYCPFGERREE